MADLEKLALKRDRSYVVRLVAMLIIAVVAAIALFSSLTGGRVGSCLADAYLGSGSGGEGSAPAPPQ